MRKKGIVAVVLSFLLGWSVNLVAAEMLDLNTASAKELAVGLHGVGDAKAAAIVQYREQYGPYRSVDDLVAVKGIGKGLLERNRDRMVISTVTDSTPQQK